MVSSGSPDLIRFSRKENMAARKHGLMPVFWAL